MADVTGYVDVYESSDAGTGDPRQTVWQFYVKDQPLVTKNPHLAETMRLALDLNKEVKVIYDPDNGNTMSQARIQINPPNTASGKQGVAG